MDFFTVEDLTAGYGKKEIIDHLSFSVDSGCLAGVLGANGSGKTTLLKAICGILPHTGSCILEGTTLEKLNPRQLSQRCSYIPQRSGISIDISVLDVVLMGFNPWLGLLERPTASMEQKGRKALALAGLEGKEQQNYQTLSEGQKQLCIFARALCCEGHLLLLDEPESALDFRFRYQMLERLRRWLSEDARAAIVTLHDPSLALNYCHRLLLLSEGKILGTLSPGTDSLPRMEELLEQIYGQISLARLPARSGREHLVMLREEA
ncbi:ABC transporter ATP-binding protein [Acetatifactor aquisgranensis]|uniref:ABC transporter ATP-binding protein n=1 Tax=Acetatifactor aquisgranensis TaxID=2941233 RepID=UPI00203B6966|nr:ABC transporter ATP-binding protein [Acetatifactor aquisgranensis]MCI8542736.1 ABC transporter ATP-binding protein [Lachnospiraceae bacterium]